MKLPKSLSFYIGLFVITSATLMLQIIQLRILSAVVWYHLAFFVISMAMFGLTVGAVWVYLKGSRFSRDTLSFDLGHYGMAFAIATTFSLAVQMTLAPISGFSATSAVVWIELAICLSIPFFFSGVVVSLALTRSPFPIGRVYGVDLAGAAAGCFGALALLHLTDAPSAVLWVGGFVALGSVFLSKSGIGTAPETGSKVAKKAPPGLWCALLLVLAMLNTVAGLPNKLRPIATKDQLELPKSEIWFEKWNSYSRITAKNPKFKIPQFWGPAPKMPDGLEKISEMQLEIDSGAGTFAYGIKGDVSKAGFLKFDITNRMG